MVTYGLVRKTQTSIVSVVVYDVKNISFGEILGISADRQELPK